MLRALAGSLVLAGVTALAACSGHGASVGSTVGDLGTGTGPVVTSFFYTPSSSGEQPVIDAINGAQSSVRMIMFHLTNPAVVDAMVAAAKRGVNIEMILDNGNLESHTPTSITKPLASAGIKVIPSSTAFRITHAKSLVIDNSTALVMSLNLTMDYATTRDYGVVTTDAGVIAEFMAIFDADVTNAQNATANTPALTSPYLAVSPVNSQSTLTAFVNSAQKTLVVTSENIGDPDIQAAMIGAVKRGVNVRIIAPLCDLNADATYDLPFLAQLAAGGVDARAMPTPSTSQVPYMHAKMMVADGTNAFVGSVNFSAASTTDAREIGIFLSNANAIATLEADFEEDWGNAITPPPASSVNCTGPGTADAGPPPPPVDAGPPPAPDAGPPPPPPPVDAGKEETSAPEAGPVEDSGPTCPGYASPTTSASCTGCSGSDCQANGCYGGYWCDEKTSACVSAKKVPCAS
jgi:cardiolipin synthase A/B